MNDIIPNRHGRIRRHERVTHVVARTDIGKIFEYFSSAKRNIENNALSRGRGGG